MPPKNTAEEATTTALEKLRPQVLAKVEGQAVVDPSEMAAAIVRRVFETDDVDAILDMGSQATVSGEDIADRPFVIQDMTWHKAGPQYQENSLGVFVALTLNMLDNDTTEVVTCGANNVIAQLFKLEETLGAPYQNDEWVKRHMRFRAVQTSQGFTTLWIARAA